MKRINNLTVEVRYTVSLGDVDVPDDVYDALAECESSELNCDDLDMTEEQNKSIEWLSDNISERDAMTWEYEILDIN